MTETDVNKYSTFSVNNKEYSQNPKNTILEKSFKYFCIIIFILGAAGFLISFIPSESISKLSNLNLVISLIFGFACFLLFIDKHPAYSEKKIKRKTFRFLARIGTFAIAAVFFFIATEKTIPILITSITGKVQETHYILVKKLYRSGRRANYNYIYNDWHKCRYKIRIAHKQKDTEKLIPISTSICTIGENAWKSINKGDIVRVIGTKSWAGSFIDRIEIIPKPS